MMCSVLESKPNSVKTNEKRLPYTYMVQNRFTCENREKPYTRNIKLHSYM